MTRFEKQVKHKRRLQAFYWGHVVGAAYAGGVALMHPTVIGAVLGYLFVVVLASILLHWRVND